MVRSAFLCVLASVAGAACSQQHDHQVEGQAEGRRAPTVTELSVTTATGRLMGRPAQLDVQILEPNQAPSKVTVFVRAGDGTSHTVAIQIPVDASFLQSSAATAGVTNGVLGTGQASIQIEQDGVASAASHGQLSLQVTDGTIHGVVTGAGADFDLQFDGAVVIQCWRPASDAPVPTAPGSAPVLSLDPTFESPHCKPYAAWGSH
jgi:hypothetical protein